VGWIILSLNDWLDGAGLDELSRLRWMEWNEEGG